MIFYLVTSDIHGFPWNIPWKSRVAWHWITWQSQNSMEFHGTNWCFIWRHQNSMEYSMELGDFLFGDSRVPCNSMEYSMQVKGNMEFFKMTISKFHGIPKKKVIFHLAAPEFHGIPWNIPWNSVIFSLSTPEFHGITWNYMEYPLEVQGKMP